MLKQFHTIQERYSARLVYYLSWLMLIVVASLTVLASLTPWLPTVVYLLPLALVCLLNLYLLSRGQLRLPATLLVTTMWLVTTFIMFAKGIYSPANYGYMVIVLLAGAVFFNERVVLVTAVFSAVATLLAGIMTAENWFLVTVMPASSKVINNPTAVYVDTFGNLTSLAVFSMLTYFTVQQTRRAFQSVATNRNLLNQQKETLEAVNAQLRHEIEERSHYEVALQASEQRFRDLFEQAPVMYVLTEPKELDGQPVIYDCNQLFLQALGYSRQEVIGKPLIAFYSAWSIEMLLPQGGYARVMENKIVEGEREFITAEGNTLDVWLRAMPRHDDHGRVIGTRAMFVDISPLKQAQRQAEAYSQQLATLHHLHIEMTRTLDINRVATTLLTNLKQETGADFASLFLIASHFQRLAETNQYAHWLSDKRGYLVVLDPSESPIFSQMLADKTAMIIADTHKHPGWILAEQAQDVRSWLGVPLIVDEQVVAFCGLDKNEPNYFTAEHLRLVESLASQTAMALENTRLHQDLREQATELEHRVANRTAELQAANQRLLDKMEERRQMQSKLVTQNQQLSVLRHIGLELAAELELSQLLEMIVLAAMDLLEADGGRLYLVCKDEERGETYLESRFTSGPTAVAEDMRLRRGESVSGRIWDSRESIMIRDYPNWAHLYHLNSASLFKSVIGVPILSQNDVLGVILMSAHEADYFDPDAVNLLELFAAHTAVALRNAQLHEQIQRYTDKLEQNVYERTQDLITANLKLRELDELKTKFISDMSHELRTPVATLGLYLDLLERRPENLNTYLNTLNSQFVRLRELVQQVVQMSDLELAISDNSMGRIHMGPLLEQVVAYQENRARAKKLTLKSVIDTAVPPIWGDALQLEQMLTQLLDNAIKYTKNGHITLRAYPHPQTGALIITIQDSGPGIPPEHRDRIFERFVRISRGGAQVRGTGIGLSFCRLALEAQDGRIWVDSPTSDAQQGSRFVFTLPGIPHFDPDPEALN
ncbi:MAG: GAF domain-containing protein [Anaerolineales bacterium]|nr:GAF domain-containing protein [Anaerolineales bacterium]